MSADAGRGPTTVRWGPRLVMIGIGWYMAQSYSRYPDIEAVNFLAMGIVTLGVILVAVAAYGIGYERALAALGATAARRRAEGGGDRR